MDSKRERLRQLQVEDGTSSDMSKIGRAAAIEVPEPENTGERLLHGLMSSAEATYDLLTRYRLSERYVEGKDTIDMGCGTGNGTHSLARTARSVLGVDLSEDAVAYASTHYRAPNLRYEAGNVMDLPYEDESFEAAVSFRVIEHLEDPEGLVVQAKRLLKGDGIFVVSTPNKQTCSIDRNWVNPHHVSEMYPPEFRELLERNFEHVQIYWQGALAGSVVTTDPQELPEDGRVTLESAQFSLPDPAFGRGFPATLYMIAVCTNGKAPEPHNQPLLILDRDRQIYDEYQDLARDLLNNQRAYYDYFMLNEQLEAQLEAAYARFRQTNKQLQEANSQVRLLRQVRHDYSTLNEELEAAYTRFRQTNKQLQEANSQVRLLRREKSEMESTRGWRIARAINLFNIKIRNTLGWRGR